MSQTTTITVPDSLPWQLNPPEAWNTFIVSASGECLAQMKGAAIYPDDARYIVHAANLYPVLIGALEKIKAEVQCQSCLKDFYQEWDGVFDLIDAALTQAREPEGT